MRHEAVVIGLGAAGAGALWALARRGVSVVGIEQFDIAHDRGSSHGRSRLFRGGAAEGVAYVDLARRSLEIWRDLEASAGVELVSLVGGVTIATAESELLRRTETAMRERELPVDVFDADELRRQFPQHRIRDEDRGLLDAATGVVRPELAITTAIDAAVAAGAVVHGGIRVDRIEQLAGGGHRIMLDDGDEIETSRVIVAGGAWTGRLVPELSSDFIVRRAVLSWFQPKPGRESEFLPDRFPVFTREDQSVTGWGAPTIDDYGVKIGLHDQAGYEIDDPAANRADVAAWELEGVEAFCARQFDGLEPVARHPRGCMITVTRDEHFSIGTLESGVVLLAACSGHGFKHSAAVGDLGARLAIDEDPELDLSLFDPYRFRTTQQ
ncbi:N-methyl-L-tryptophan oxidase [Agromyces sp. Marseille-P2726]|uniref:N-methyl-L-tryptophan oxidase n=1 Tax=Agromyces sp. Marseille-P2726 TaxID=2709132 RepID=UPI00156FB7A6|nr:N-methyl-L-tryptophan oxidase [Agromyces sp. Marseille-P2726]